jgi:hypothetical protein
MPALTVPSPSATARRVTACDAVDAMRTLRAWLRQLDTALASPGQRHTLKLAAAQCDPLDASEAVIVRWNAWRKGCPNCTIVTMGRIEAVVAEATDMSRPAAQPTEAAHAHR